MGYKKMGLRGVEPLSTGPNPGTLSIKLQTHEISEKNWFINLTDYILN